MPELSRIPWNAGAGEVCSALNRDGACIVEDAANANYLAGLNRDFDSLVATSIDAKGPEPRSSTHVDMARFYGAKTIRMDGIPGKSTTFVDFMLDPLMHEVCGHVLRPNCPDYLLNVAQLIQIEPGEAAQRLHRDEEAWSHIPRDSPNLSVQAMIALTEFNAENGATRVVPGSHLWDLQRKPQANEIVQAAMPAGSALYYLGKTLHGGGANISVNQSRRGMFYGYALGWLRTGENMFLTVPIEKVRRMPRRVQELLGYKSLGGIGVVDVGSPMERLR